LNGTRKLIALTLALLAQACATPSAPPPIATDEPAVGTVLEQAPQAPEPKAAEPAKPPAPAPQPTAKPSPSVPFEGERQVVTEPLRGVTKIDRTVPPDDLWERIRRGFAIPDLDDKLVRDKVAYYASRPDYLQRVFDRSRLYLFHIVEEIEKRGLPTELALLPMVESAFNPMAYSRAHASGIWQFIPGTGRRFELEQNWWYDKRRDIVDSTNAALDYLTKLYEMHGDWHLALASYNWGENAVARAIAKNRKAGKPADYAHLRMPAETRHYIPKLQALKNIIANPKPFGINLDPIPNQAYFATVTEVPDIDVQLAAKLAEMPVDEFIALNPGFSRPLIRAAVTPRIVLPADKVDVFHENLTKLDPGSLVSWKAYHPKKGETFESIARKFGVPLSYLKEVNGISPRNKTVPNLLVVPFNGAVTTAKRLPIMYAPPIPVRVKRIFHTVRRGETAMSIARRYGVALEDIKRWNPGSKIAVGQKVALEVRVASKPRKGKAKSKAKGRPYKNAA
jgi:membrane-bound lytic murein transglycosylase D